MGCTGAKLAIGGGAGLMVVGMVMEDGGMFTMGRGRPWHWHRRRRLFLLTLPANEVGAQESRRPTPSEPHASAALLIFQAGTEGHLCSWSSQVVRSWPLTYFTAAPTAPSPKCN